MVGVDVQVGVGVGRVQGSGCCGLVIGCNAVLKAVWYVWMRYVLAVFFK